MEHSDQLDRWGVSDQGADGALRVPGVYGVPEQWPHAGRLPRPGGWADIGNLHVTESHRRHDVGALLIGRAAEWLQLARLDRVLDYP